MDGRIYGRGAMDDKGPAMAAVYAMKDILDSGRKLNKRVRIIFGCQEETGDWVDMEYYKETKRFPPSAFYPDVFPAIYGEKGILMVRLSMEASKIRLCKDQRRRSAQHGGRLGERDFGRRYGSGGKRQSCPRKHTPEEGENAISKLMEKAADF